VTHPFHPLRGREFAVVDIRSAWGERRVYFHDEAGELKRMPAAWTSLAEVDPFVVISAGRCALRVADLLQLVDVLNTLRDAPGRRRRERAAASVKRNTPRK